MPNPKRHIVDNNDTAGQVSDGVNWGTCRYELLNGIALGTAYDQRTGRSAHMAKLSGRFNLYYDETDPATPAPAMVTVMIVHDKIPGSSVPTDSELLQASGNNSQFLSFLNPDHMHRFTVLKRWTIGTGPTQGVKFPIGDLYNEFSLNLDYTTFYSGQGATVNDIQSGALWLVVTARRTDSTSTSTGLNELPLLAHNIRLEYDDL